MRCVDLKNYNTYHVELTQSVCLISLELNQTAPIIINNQGEGKKCNPDQRQLLTLVDCNHNYLVTNSNGKK